VNVIPQILAAILMPPARVPGLPIKMQNIPNKFTSKVIRPDCWPPMLMSKYVRGRAIVHKRLTGENLSGILVGYFRTPPNHTTKLQRGSNHVPRSDL